MFGVPRRDDIKILNLGIIIRSLVSALSTEGVNRGDYIPFRPANLEALFGEAIAN